MLLVKITIFSIILMFAYQYAVKCYIGSNMEAKIRITVKRYPWYMYVLAVWVILNIILVIVSAAWLLFLR